MSVWEIIGIAYAVLSIAMIIYMVILIKEAGGSTIHYFLVTLAGVAWPITLLLYWIDRLRGRVA